MLKAAEQMSPSRGEYTAVPQATLISCSIVSEQCLKQVCDWLYECESNHKSCPRTESHSGRATSYRNQLPEVAPQLISEKPQLRARILHINR